MDGWTDGRTEGMMDQWTDGQTDRPFYRDARTHLQIRNQFFHIEVTQHNATKTRSYLVMSQTKTKNIENQLSVESRLHNNAFKGVPPLMGKMLQSQNHSSFCNVKIPLP